MLVITLIVAAFGPYVAGSIRTEQLVVYALAPLLAVLFIRLRSWAVGFLASWLFILVVVTIGHVFSYEGFAPWKTGSVLSGYDSLLLPLVIMGLIWTVVSAARAAALLRLASVLTVVLAACNALVAIASSLMPSLVFALQPFWAGGSVGPSVAERAMSMGRMSGIFNQPAEAGLVYSLGAVLAVWSFSKRPGLMYLLGGIIAVGGMFTVSKVFLLVGLPVCLILLFKTRGFSGRMGVVGAGILLLMFLGTATFFQEWMGLNYLTRLFEVPDGQTILEFYTSGRWTRDSAIFELMSYILSVSPLVGMGIGGLAVPYDSLWTEAIVLGGLLMVVAMIVILSLLLRAFQRIPDRDLRLTAYAFWVIVVGASFGIPSLTVNRAATVVWVIAALLVASAASTKKVSGNA